MANLTGKLEAEVEIKSDAGEFFHHFGAKAHHLPNVVSDKVKGIDVHEGEWKTHGCVKLWTYEIDGKVEKFKEKLSIDEKNMTLSATGIEGGPMKDLKSYKATLQVIAKGGSNFANWTIYYEKRNENSPIPTNYLNWLVNLAKDIDASLPKV